MHGESIASCNLALKRMCKTPRKKIIQKSKANIFRGETDKLSQITKKVMNKIVQTQGGGEQGNHYLAYQIYKMGKNHIWDSHWNIRI